MRDHGRRLAKLEGLRRPLPAGPDSLFCMTDAELEAEIARGKQEAKEYQRQHPGEDLEHLEDGRRIRDLTDAELAIGIARLRRQLGREGEGE